MRSFCRRVRFLCRRREFFIAGAVLEAQARPAALHRLHPRRGRVGVDLQRLRALPARLLGDGCRRAERVRRNDVH